MQAYAEPNRVDLERQEENKMGRPINKRNIGSGAGKIEVTAYYFTGASEVLSSATPAWIVSQRSNNKFKVTDGSTTEVLTLSNLSTGALTEGTFTINAKDNTGTLTQVTKLRNRTVQTEDSGNYPYSISDANSGSAAERTIDSQ